MKRSEIVEWLTNEFGAVQLATPPPTVSQIVDNAMRYWNTHSGYKIVKMVDTGRAPINNEQVATGDGVTLAFSFAPRFHAITPASLVLSTQVAGATVTLTDDGIGNITGATGTGTVNYVTGAITLLFNSGYAPNQDASIKASYVFNGGQGYAIPIDPEVKMVVSVYPAVSQQVLWQDTGFWKLFGIVIIDNVTSDLIQLTEGFKNYQVYVGTDFRWTSERSQDPTEYGMLYYSAMPNNTSQLCIVGTKRILPDEDIRPEHILNWILYYSKALLKMVEGNALRKSDIIGIRNDGQELYNEGKDEKAELEKTLAVEGRWVCLAQRF